jgi:hypothetical protein
MGRNNIRFAHASGSIPPPPSPSLAERMHSKRRTCAAVAPWCLTLAASLCAASIVFILMTGATLFLFRGGSNDPSETPRFNPSWPPFNVRWIPPHFHADGPSQGSLPALPHPPPRSACYDDVTRNRLHGNWIRFQINEAAALLLFCADGCCGPAALAAFLRTVCPSNAQHGQSDMPPAGPGGQLLFQAPAARP